MCRRGSGKIPMDLIVNWDQTGVRLVPVSKWTMAETGSKQVEVRDIDEMCEMTVLLSISMSGNLFLPPISIGLDNTAPPSNVEVKQHHTCVPRSAAYFIQCSLWVRERNRLQAP